MTTEKENMVTIEEGMYSYKGNTYFTKGTDINSKMRVGGYWEPAVVYYPLNGDNVDYDTIYIRTVLEFESKFKKES